MGDKNYWTEETDKQVLAYLEKGDQAQFNMAYPAIYRLCEYWSNTAHANVNMPADELRDELIGFAWIVVTKWDRKNKLYSYLGTCLRNYIFTEKINKNNRQKAIKTYLEEEGERTTADESPNQTAIKFRYKSRLNRSGQGGKYTSFPFLQRTERNEKLAKVFLDFLNSTPSLHSKFTGKKELHHLIRLQFLTSGIQITNKEIAQLKGALRLR